MPVVIVALRVRKKDNGGIISRLTCLWESVSVNFGSKRNRTRLYYCKIRSNKVGCSTSEGPYCTAHNDKVIFFMPDFFSRKIISHHFCIYNNKGKLDIGCDMII